MTNSSEIHVFTDGSVEPVSKVGYGAALLVTNLNEPIDNLKMLVKVKCFENTSSTKIEIQTLLWILEELKPFSGKLILHTDSQNIEKLLDRKERLQNNNFLNKQNRPIKNSALYREFYRFTDELNIEIIKVRGHNRTRLKNNTDHIFTLVDRASRKALREKT